MFNHLQWVRSKLGQEVEKRGLTEEGLLADLEDTKREVAEARYSRITQQ